MLYPARPRKYAPGETDASEREGPGAPGAPASSGVAPHPAGAGGEVVGGAVGEGGGASERSFSTTSWPEAPSPPSVSSKGTVAPEDSGSSPAEEEEAAARGAARGRRAGRAARFARRAATRDVAARANREDARETAEAARRMPSVRAPRGRGVRRQRRPARDHVRNRPRKNE